MQPTLEFFNMLQGTWQNKLHGEWIDSWGWNIISQPKLGAPTISDFNIRVDQMRETITFKKIGQARNIGVTGEAGFWQSMAYEISIEDLTGEGIHHEMGHFLIQVLEDETTAHDLKAPVIRQATIPRANSFMTHGQLRVGSISSFLTNEPGGPFYSSRAVTQSTRLQQEVDRQLKAQQQMVTQNSGPDLQNPIPWLGGILPNLKPKTIDWVFSFRTNQEPSQMASGQRVQHPVQIGNLLSDFWIGERVIREKEAVKVLQYAQEVNLKFNENEWPHVAVNTLVKQNP